MNLLDIFVRKKHPLDGVDSALMVVDMQEIFVPENELLPRFYPDGKKELSGEYLDRKDNLIKIIKEKIEKYIDHKGGILIVTMVNEGPTIDVINKTYEGYEKILSLSKCDFSVLDGSIRNSRLLKPIKNIPIEIVGVNTTACVKSTAMDLHKEGFKISILLKATLNKFSNLCESSSGVEIDRETPLTLDEFLRDNSLDYIFGKYGKFKNLFNLTGYDENVHKYIWDLPS